MIETAQAIQRVSKPVTAIVDGIAASAAYAIASQADEIRAASEAAIIGSIGVVQTTYREDDAVEITSTEAPYKRPDPDSDEGLASIRAELDEMHALMVRTIAEGRGTTADHVNEHYGRGGTMLAARALENGLIDSIGRPREIMDLPTLQTQHPDIYSAVQDAARAEVTAEVTAHLESAQAAGGAFEVAIEAIKSGEGMTAAWSRRYIEAALQRGNRTPVTAAEDRRLDEPDLGHVSGPQLDANESLAAAIRRNHGI